MAEMACAVDSSHTSINNIGNHTSTRMHFIIYIESVKIKQ